MPTALPRGALVHEKQDLAQHRLSRLHELVASQRHFKPLRALGELGDRRAVRRGVACPKRQRIE